MFSLPRRTPSSLRGPKGLASRIGFTPAIAVLLGLLATATALAGEAEGLPAAKPNLPPHTKVLIVAAVVFAALLLKAAIVAAATLASAMAPHRTASVERRVSARAGWLFLVGVADALALLALLAVVGGVAKRLPALNLVLLALIVAGVCLALLGTAGVYAAIGRRLGAAGPGGVLRGGALFEPAALFPIVGVLASVVVFCIALGGASLTLLEKRAVPPEPGEPAA